MGGHGIVGQGSAFFTQIEIVFADFKEYLDIPSFSVNAHDLIFIQPYIRGDKTEIFLTFIPVSDINNFCPKVAVIFYNFDHNGKQIPGASAPFLVTFIDRHQRHIFTVIPEEHFGIFFTIPITSYPISLTECKMLGEENQLSKRTYFRDCSFFSSLEKFQHGMCSLLHGKHTAFIAYGSFVNGLCLIEPVLFVFG